MGVSAHEARHDGSVVVAGCCVTKMDGSVETVAFFCCAAISQDGWVVSDQVRLPSDDLGFRQAVTAVERLRTIDGQPHLVERHLARFAATLEHLEIDGADFLSQLPALTDELLGRNEVACRGWGDVGITWWATPGAIGRGMGAEPSPRPSYAVELHRLDHAAIARRRGQGQAVVVTPIEQPPPSSWSRHAKTRCRLHYYLADRYAAQRCPGAMGLLVDRDGSITESSVANVAIVVDGEIVSPPLDRILRGVTQWEIERVAARIGVPWNYQPLFSSDLRSAAAVLLMGTDSRLWFANQVDGEATSFPDKMGVFHNLTKYIR